MAAYKSGDSDIGLGVSAEEVTIGMKNASSLGLVVNELFMNAFKYAFAERPVGTVNITLRRRTVCLNSRWLTTEMVFRKDSPWKNPGVSALGSR